MLNFLLSRPVQITLGVLLVVALIAIFIISCILNHKTPVPKGCENLKPDESTCKGCQLSASCPIKAVPEKKEEKKDPNTESKEKNEHE